MPSYDGTALSYSSFGRITSGSTSEPVWKKPPRAIEEQAIEAPRRGGALEPVQVAGPLEGASEA